MQKLNLLDEICNNCTYKSYKSNHLHRILVKFLSNLMKKSSCLQFLYKRNAKESSFLNSFVREFVFVLCKSGLIKLSSF